MKVSELIEILNKLTDTQKEMDVVSEDYEDGILDIEIVEEITDYFRKKSVIIIK